MEEHNGAMPMVKWTFTKSWHAANQYRAAVTGLAFATFSTFAADQPQMNLDDQEQLDVQSNLYWLTLAMWVLIIGLLIFAYSIRYIAKRTTRPCWWCCEFISKKAGVCPRCGKKQSHETPAQSIPSKAA